MRLTEWFQRVIIDSLLHKRVREMNLFEALNTLGRRINRSYPALNEGGCCVYAATIGEELLKRGLKVRVVIANSFEAKKNLNRVRHKVNNTNQKRDWNSAGIYFNHVGVEFKLGGKWFLYDSDGVNPRGKKLGSYQVHPGFISVADAKALADESKGWNCSFSRRSIPHLKKHIKNFLATALPEKVVDQIPA